MFVACLTLVVLTGRIRERFLKQLVQVLGPYCRASPGDQHLQRTIRPSWNHQ